MKTWLDNCIHQFDAALKTLYPPTPRMTARPAPGADLDEAALSPSRKKHIAGLMRVNHAGEVCAQALYQGQALTAQLAEVRAEMQTAAQEELDHLSWCEQRLQALDSHTSYLNPLWYAGSFCLGAIAGYWGDKWSLGFVAETERQVCAHLETHIQQLQQYPVPDNKSLAVLQQMHQDEAQHAAAASQAGGVPLPNAVKVAMRYSAKIMTGTTYYL